MKHKMTHDSEPTQVLTPTAIIAAANVGISAEKIQAMKGGQPADLTSGEIDALDAELKRMAKEARDEERADKARLIEARKAKKAQRAQAKRQQKLAKQGVAAEAKARKKARKAKPEEVETPHIRTATEGLGEAGAPDEQPSGEKPARAKRGAAKGTGADHADAKPSKVSGVNEHGIPTRFAKSPYYDKARLSAPGLRVSLPLEGQWTLSVWRDLISGLSFAEVVERCPVNPGEKMQPSARAFYRRAVRRELEYMKAAGFRAPACEA